MLHLVVDTLARMRRAARAAGPYVALELLLPGGTLIALLVLLVRHAPFVHAVALARATATPVVACLHPRVSAAPALAAR